MRVAGGRQATVGVRLRIAGLVTGGVLPAIALATPGDLDPNFNGTGTRVIEFNMLPAVQAGANGMALQADGKIVLAIYHEVLDSSSFAVMRLNPDGSPDPGFAGGLVVRQFGGGPAEALAVAVQQDGKIVAGGFVEFNGESKMVVVRFNPDGTPDADFGGDFSFDGLAVADFGPMNESGALAVALQKDGRIVAAGVAREGGELNFALARFASSGRLDPGFSADGKVVTDFGDNEFARAVAVQKDGRLVAAGTSNEDFAVARYLSNGGLDRSFGAGGKVVTDFGGVDRTLDQANALALQPDGRILVAGGTRGAGNLNLALARYQKNGRLDRSFDRDGRVTSDLTVVSLAFGVALQQGGRFLVGGVGASNNDLDFLVARYQKNGRLDPSFGNGGFVTTDLGGDEIGNALALQQDGKALLAGARNQAGTQIALARYLAR